MNDIIDVATLYVTNRPLFEQQYGDTLHKDYLDMLFIGAATRPEIAEDIPVRMMGYTLKEGKHGLDGLPGQTDGYAEAKVTTTDTVRTARSGFGSITINDPSPSIVEKYEQYQPEFIFPVYIDGLLITIYTVEWKHLRPYYMDGLQRIKKNNLQGKPTRNFSLTATKILEHAKVRFVYCDKQVARDKLTMVKANTIIKKLDSENEL